MNCETCKLTQTQAEIILAYAECSMNRSKTARKLYRNINDIYYQLKKIKEDVGIDPRQYYELKKLENLARAALGKEPESPELHHLTLNEYQAFSRRAIARKFNNLSCAGLGLAGESGEIVELIRKHCWQGHELLEEGLIEKLGDVLWYVALIAGVQGVSLEEVARKNIEKLHERYPECFSEGKSILRK